MVDEDSLDRDAGLAGITKSTGRTTLRREIQVCVRLDDDTGIAAQLQHHFFLPALFPQHPPHCCASGKTQQLKARIDDQKLSHPIVTWKHVPTTGWHTSLHRHVTQ